MMKLPEPGNHDLVQRSCEVHIHSRAGGATIEAVVADLDLGFQPTPSQTKRPGIRWAHTFSPKDWEDPHDCYYGSSTIA